MDRTKEILAWLRTVFALLVVLEAPLAVWLFRNYQKAAPATTIAGLVVAMSLLAGIVWTAVVALRFINQLRNE